MALRLKISSGNPNGKTLSDMYVPENQYEIVVPLREVSYMETNYK